MKEIKFSTALLTALVIGIWGTIAYQVYVSMTDDDGEALQPARRFRVTAPAAYVYKADVRDPFRFVLQPRRDTTRARALSRVVWMPPPLKLTGVISAGKKRTAMIESQDGGVFFLQMGDTIHGVKVLKINSNSVQYVFQKKKDKWILDHPGQ